MANNQWYKDMVFYQIWPRSFKDGKGGCFLSQRNYLIS